MPRCSEPVFKVEPARQLVDQKETLACVSLIDGWASHPDQANHDRVWFENILKTEWLSQALQCIEELVIGLS